MLKLGHFVASIMLSSAAALSAQASLVAGWDFSQYDTSFGQVLTTDGSTLTNTLRANYSSLDSTAGQGAESAAFGLMTLPFTPVGDGSEAFLHVANSLLSNLNLPVPNPFDSFTNLTLEGQAFTNLLRMASYAAVSVVFEADLTSVPQIGSDWQISFGAQAMPGAAGSAITIEFSTDGTNYVSFGSVNVTGVDTAYAVNLGSAASDRAFVRLGFAPGASIDNVGILANLATVPEPLTASLLLAGLGGLALLGRRRS